MFKKLVACLLLLVASPAFAIECLASAQDQQPILVIGSIDSEIRGFDTDKFGDLLRERLGSNFRVLLSDQYQYAVQRGEIDRCTPQFQANIQLNAETSNVVVNGDRLQDNFSGFVQVFRLPEKVTQDRFRLKPKRLSFGNLFLAGSQKALDKLVDSLVNDVVEAFQSRREDWVRTRTPGFNPAGSPASQVVTRQSDAVAAPAASIGYVRIEFIGRDPPPSFTFQAASSDTNRVNGASAGIRFTGVNLPCNTYHLYVDNPPGAGGSVARETDLCVANNFIVLPSEVYTLRNRSGADLVSRNVRVQE